MENGDSLWGPLKKSVKRRQGMFWIDVLIVNVKFKI